MSFMPYGAKYAFASFSWNFQMSHTARTRIPGMRARALPSTLPSAPNPIIAMFS